jgi:hypothetical protein
MRILLGVITYPIRLTGAICIGIGMAIAVRVIGQESQIYPKVGKYINAVMDTL